MNKLALIALLLYGCLPVAVKARCEVMAKTDYERVTPEQKCGGAVEVTVWEVGGW